MTPFISQRVNSSTRRHGFTLIELLVVVTIITLLIALLMPSMKGAIRAARLVVCASNSRQLTLSLLSYASDYDRMTPPTGYYAKIYDQMQYSHYYAGRSGFQNWGTLDKNGYLDPHGDVWFCPLTTLLIFQNPHGPDPSHPNNAALLPEDGHLGWTFARSAYMRNGFPDYTGRNQYKPIPISYIKDKAIIADAFSEPTYVYDTGHGDGVTVGYGDGSVKLLIFDQTSPYVIYWKAMSPSYITGNNSQIKTLWSYFDRQ